MTGYISFGFLVLIALFIIFLFIRRNRIETELDAFYQKNQFYRVKEIPDSIQNAIGKGNWIYFKSSLIIEHKPFEFYWLERIVSSTLTANNTSQTTLNYFLVIAFPPKAVSQEFISQVLEWKNSASPVKDFFVLNTENPIRAEKLPDGSFLIEWNVLNRADVYQQKLNWLQANIS